MKRFLGVLSVILSLLLVVTLGLFSASAALPPQYYGDANLDHYVDITDATFIQKYLSDSVELDEYLPKLAKELADIDHDGKITVKDATFIQKVLASLIDHDFYEDSVTIDTHLTGIYMDYDSGKAMAGEPVTFTVVGGAGWNPPQPYTTSFFVNDELVFEGLEEKSWQYTFEQAGTYDIYVEIESPYGMTSSETVIYEVVEPYAIDRLNITAVMPDDFYPYYGDTFSVVAYAKGGSAPYEYAFTMVSAEGEILLQQDYSENNKFTIPFYTVHGVDTYPVYVVVRDADGKTETVIYSLEFGESRPPA